MRRFSLLVGAAVLGAAWLPAGAMAGEPGGCAFGGRFYRIVREAVGPARLAAAGYVAMVLRTDGEVLCAEEVNGMLALSPASTIKTLVAVGVLQRIDRGEARLSDTVVIDQPNAAADCRDSSCAVYGPGKRVSVRRLLRDMIVSSNNVATNQLIDLAGKRLIAETAARVGAGSLRVLRKLYNHQPAEPDIPTPNQGTAAGLAALYREVATGRLGVLRPASRRRLVALLGRTRYQDRLDADFPPGVRFFHKIGNTSTVSGDGGFYRLGRRTLVVLVGLQGFVDYRPLREVGRRTLALTRSMR